MGSMQLTDLILYPSRGDVAGAIAFLDGPDATDREFATRLWHWCALAGVDYAIAYAWFCVETANATSVRWTRDHNPGGIGIPADSTVQPFTIPDGDHAARIHTQCYYAAVIKHQHPDVPLWPEAQAWMDGVWLPKVTNPTYPRVRHLTDLDIRYIDASGESHATWAWGFSEGQPAQTCIDRARAIWPALPNQRKDTNVPASVTRPPIYDLGQDYERFGLTEEQADIILSKRITNRLGYQPQAIVWHIQDGTTRGSLAYWVNVQASSTVMIQKDGSILNIIPRQHGPWTNGDVSNPSARGRTLVSLAGGDPNRVSITCEMEGVPGDLLTPAQENAAVWWALDVMREFPHIDMNDHYQHADLNSVTRPRCPNGYYGGLMQRIKAATTGPKPKPKPTIDWVRGETGLDTYNGGPVLKMVAPAKIVADTTSRYGGSTSAKAYKRYKKGTNVVIVGTFDSRWAVIDAGDGAFPRVSMTRLSPSYPTPKDA